MTKDYNKIAKETRVEVLGMIHRGHTSHIASNFSAVDLAVVLYENADHEKDYILWSKGWSAALAYSLLARHGFIQKEELQKFPNFPYLGLLEPGIPGVYGAGGAMGHLLPIAVGMALAKKRAKEDGVIYCIMSDGELNEGTTWESAMVAAHHKLDNLVVIVDKNGWQAMGETSEVLNINPPAMFDGFGWGVYTIDGHNFEEIEATLTEAASDFFNDQPTVIIANTIKGKGVSFMENHILYHYKHVDEENYQKALEELK